MKTAQRIFWLLVFLSDNFISAGQDFNWWKNNVNWDGSTHWYNYLRILPGYMGPNALSVPSINNGSADSVTSFGVTAQAHFSKGDNTQNAMLYGNYTTRDHTISVDAQFIPYEKFQMSHDIKTERKTYYEKYQKNQTLGDVMINTTIQLFQKRQSKRQMAIRLGVRMPSGGGVELARYTDVPAYWFDLGLGLPIKNSHWKWFGMSGFFVWQLNQGRLRQDDAFLFGSGVEWNHKGTRFQAYAAGYAGYQNDGDQPMVIRVNLEKKRKRNIYLLRLQQGLNDYKYFSIESGLKWVFSK